MRLTKPQRTALSAIFERRRMPRRQAVLFACGDLAAAGLIAPIATEQLWALTLRGREVLDAERARLGAKF